MIPPPIGRRLEGRPDLIAIQLITHAITAGIRRWQAGVGAKSPARSIRSISARAFMPQERSANTLWQLHAAAARRRLRCPTHPCGALVDAVATHVHESKGPSWQFEPAGSTASDTSASGDWRLAVGAFAAATTRLPAVAPAEDSPEESASHVRLVVFLLFCWCVREAVGRQRDRKHRRRDGGHIIRPQHVSRSRKKRA